MLQVYRFSPDSGRRDSATLFGVIFHLIAVATHADVDEEAADRGRSFS